MNGTSRITRTGSEQFRENTTLVGPNCWRVFNFHRHGGKCCVPEDATRTAPAVVTASLREVKSACFMCLFGQRRKARARIDQFSLSKVGRLYFNGLNYTESKA